MKQRILHIMLLVSVLTVALGFTSCDEVDENWYLSGTWQCQQYPSETMVFRHDGSGAWMNDLNGDYEPFEYFCSGDYLWINWLPLDGAPYQENCTIYMPDPESMEITYPGDYSTGPYTLFYYRIY